MNIIFFGSSKHSVIVAKKLHETVGLSFIVTIPDKPIGRKQILTPSPVKEFATEQHIPIITAHKLTDDIIEKIEEVHPDFLVVADYGLILPKKILEMPTYAPINVHHSLLPKYRGSSPAPSAILNGDAKTGVSIIIMHEKVDAGDILSQKEYTMKPDETTDSLLTQLNNLGADILIPVIKNFEQYYQKRIKQDETKATFTKMMTKTDGYIETTNPPKPEILDRMIRAYYPWPGVWTELKLKNKEPRIKLLPISSHPELVSGSSHMLLQPEGKKPMSVKDFVNGYPEAKEFIEKLGV
jgi:methionyl-tRNA formyltransferase